MCKTNTSESNSQNCQVEQAVQAQFQISSPAWDQDPIHDPFGHSQDLVEVIAPPRLSQLEPGGCGLPVLLPVLDIKYGNLNHE